MTTPLVLDAIEHAIWTRRREGIADLSELIHHNDRGSQYTSIAFTDKLIEEGIDASIGSTGSSYDNALAETINGLYKTELIKPRGPWRTVKHVEIATLEGGLVQPPTPLRALWRCASGRTRGVLLR